MGEGLALSKKTLGERIRDERQHRNMSQYQLSEQTKTLQAQINAMENGRPNFSKEKLKVVLDCLGIKAHPSDINKYHQECHQVIKMGEIAGIVRQVEFGTVLERPNGEESLSDDAAILIKEVEELKYEIEEWLKRDNKGIKGWISAVDSARKLFTKVLEII